MYIPINLILHTGYLCKFVRKTNYFELMFCSIFSINFSCCRMIPLTTVGSARVLTSPSWSNLFAAMLRKILRIIFPDRVFGRPGEICNKIRFITLVIFGSRLNIKLISFCLNDDKQTIIWALIRKHNLLKIRCCYTMPVSYETGMNLYRFENQFIFMNNTRKFPVPWSRNMTDDSGL